MRKIVELLRDVMMKSTKMRKKDAAVRHGYDKKTHQRVKDAASAVGIRFGRAIEKLADR